MKKMIRQNLLLWISSVALLALLVTFLTARFEELESRISLLESEQRDLLTELDRREDEKKGLEARLVEQEAQINRLNQPQEINGPAEFPIARVLVRADDTIETLAHREKTAPQVVYALNPWLDRESVLIEGQALWVPVQ